MADLHLRASVDLQEEATQIQTTESNWDHRWAVTLGTEALARSVELSEASITQVNHWGQAACITTEGELGWQDINWPSVSLSFSLQANMQIWRCIMRPLEMGSAEWQEKRELLIRYKERNVVSDPKSVLNLRVFKGDRLPHVDSESSDFPTSLVLVKKESSEYAALTDTWHGVLRPLLRKAGVPVDFDASTAAHTDDTYKSPEWVRSLLTDHQEDIQAMQSEHRRQRLDRFRTPVPSRL